MALRVTVVGLTGGIAMGKTTVGGQFAALGAKVLSSDAVVHALLGAGGAAVTEVAALFPHVLINGAIDRMALGRAVFGNPAALAKLEAVLHPKVVEAQREFVQAAGGGVVVLDIPLLFETGAEARCDYTVTVSAPPEVQRRRALSREGMTEEKLEAILARQWTDERRRAAADFVVPTGTSEEESFRKVKEIMEKIT